MKLAIAVATAAALASGAALAQDKGKSGDKNKAAQEERARWEATFKKADANGDGGLSKDELAKTGPKAFPSIKKNFDAMDANKDGRVTIAERDAYGAARQEKAKDKAKDKDKGKKS